MANIPMIMILFSWLAVFDYYAFIKPGLCEDYPKNIMCEVRV